MGSIFLLVLISLGAGLAAWLFFLWAVRSGQYDDVEGPKHRMMDDDHSEKRDKTHNNMEEK